MHDPGPSLKVQQEFFYVYFRRTIVFIDDSNVGLVHYIHKPKKRMVTLVESSLSGILKGENNVGST